MGWTEVGLSWKLQCAQSWGQPAQQPEWSHFFGAEQCTSFKGFPGAFFYFPWPAKEMKVFLIPGAIDGMDVRLSGWYGSTCLVSRSRYGLAPRLRQWFTLEEGKYGPGWLDRVLFALKQWIPKWAETGLCRGEGAWESSEHGKKARVGKGECKGNN